MTRLVPCVDCGTVRKVTYRGAVPERCLPCAMAYQAAQRRAHHPGAWIADGLCGQVAPELWFNENSPTAVKRVCGRCPVESTCLDWAIETDQPHGVWGGMTRTERLLEEKRREAA